MSRLLRRDALAGLMFIAFSAWGFAVCADLEAGTASEMGPGYFPRLVSGIVLLLGVAIVINAVREAVPLPVAAGRWRPSVCVSLACLVFAALLEPAGVVAAIAATVLVGALAGERPRAPALLALIAGLALATVALFIWGLGIPMSIGPDWEVIARRWN